MSIFRDLTNPGTRANWSLPFSFRFKLTLLLMLVVLTATLLALYVTQRSQQAEYRRSLQDKFQSRLEFLLGARYTHEAVVSEQCRQLARNVRIQAALEENDIDDLYANANVELRNILGTEELSDVVPGFPRATFFRFMSVDGKLIEPPGITTAPWEEQLVALRAGSKAQQIGYIVDQLSRDGTEIKEVVATSILDSQGEPTAWLLLGFPFIDPAMKPDSELKTGLWINGRLHIPSLSVVECSALGESLSSFTQGATHADNSFNVDLDGKQYLLFYKILNPGSSFPPAYEVCLYSIDSALAAQERVRWKILALALVALMGGLTASHFFSTHLSRPVEQLQEVSAKNLVARDEAEAARKMTEAKYQSIFENAVEGIFVLDAEGRFLSGNPAMARIFHYESAAQFMAETADKPGKLYVEKMQWTEFMERVKKEGTVSSFECEAQCRDGAVIWISQNARAVRDATTSTFQVEGTVEDITERKRAADSLRTLNVELEKALGDLKATQKQVIQQERLRALGQMASGIAHDFNNSLMPVMGFAELLLAQPAVLADQTKATGYLEMIRTAAKDGASIVGRLREFYRSNEDSDVFTPVDLSKLVRQVVTLTQPKWKGQAQAKGVEIRIVEELEDVPAIAGNESALREVLTNLIFNAVDAMPQGGSITLRTRSEASRVILEICDTGSGMTEEVRQRCLEPFFTTKGDGGTGLGLAMVFGIVQRHDGTIDLQTCPGTGTTFSLDFPCPTGGTAAIKTETVRLPSVSALGILLVDDDPGVRGVLSAFLEVDGHQVTVAESGTEGLKLFQQNKFDLVITDKAIPGMSGDKMAVEIKKLSPKMPVILLSGFNAGGTDEKLPGIDVIASKPITIPALRAAVRTAMETV